MIIKLENSIFCTSRDLKIESAKQTIEPLNHKERVTVDRIVIAVLFLIVITAAILF